ncbi:hypothetical protein NDN08_004499 [Rhodosorus marinus]|uniref:Dolichyl-diphosphooligosaccharide-protein glycosyltransferase subunit OST5 n=1 Tax=Rhodosorus marinus TaxID=101924 RepID=A0AAV8UPH6_9RHOD|nr:hypothetical protein NDN08_004499 [Rhodosorus marinus]
MEEDFLADLRLYKPFTMPLHGVPFGLLATIFLCLGLGFAGWFMATVVTSNKYNKNIPLELVYAGISSIFMSLGIVMMLLANGVWI